MINRSSFIFLQWIRQLWRLEGKWMFSCKTGIPIHAENCSCALGRDVRSKWLRWIEGMKKSGRPTATYKPVSHITYGNGRLYVRYQENPSLTAAPEAIRFSYEQNPLPWHCQSRSPAPLSPITHLDIHKSQSTSPMHFSLVIQGSGKTKRKYL